MNKLVNFELAKMLKEKGFDKICYKAFLFKIYQPSNIYEENIEAIKNAENYSNSEYEKYYRPTIGEVVMWLYENRDIWIVVDYYNNDDKDIWFYNYKTKNKESMEEGFSSPTEAYEAAIEYCLTNLV